jgi:hypothetical protein
MMFHIVWAPPNKTILYWLEELGESIGMVEMDFCNVFSPV